MKKFVFSFLALSAIVVSSSAQKLEDGVKSLYYERYKSAQSVLSKLGGAGSQDPKSIYWYGISLLDDPSNPNGVAQAKDLYQKALSSGINSPWILVGLGHVDLLTNNDIAAAKQKFEQAISLSASANKKGKPDVDILDAVGRANADGSATTGDPAYAIEKLKQAAELDPKNSDVLVNLGLNILKSGAPNAGGEAVSAFTKASEIDPKYAKGFYEVGKIYSSQNNTESVYEWLGKANTADPAYGPAYYAFFKYNVGPKGSLADAKEYLDKYIANSDQDCDVKALAVELEYKSGKSDAALAKANTLEAEGCQSGTASLYKAYALRNNKDEAGAAKAISKYFELTPAANITALQCIDATRLFVHTNQKDSAIKYYELGYKVSGDNKTFKRIFADSAAYFLKESNKPEERVVWLKNKLDATSEANKNLFGNTLFEYGQGAVEAASATKKAQYYATADSAFGVLKKLFPDKAFGYQAQANNAIAWDTTFEKAATPINEYVNEFLAKDPTKNAKALATYRGILGTYYANTKKDYDAALKEYNEILAIDPNNANAKAAIELVTAKKQALTDIQSVQDEQKKHEEEEKAYQATLEKAKADSINDLLKKDSTAPAKKDSTSK